MTYDEMLKELDRIKQQDIAVRKAEAEAVKVENRNRQITRLQLDIVKRKNDLVVMDHRLKAPKIIIQDKANQGSMEKWRSLGAAEKDLLIKSKGFNQFLLKFGNKSYSLIGLLFTQAIGLYWVWGELGLDAMGSTWLTIVTAVLVLLAVDVIGYLAVVGCFASLGNFIADRRYHRLLEVVLASGFAVGLICFACNAILRVLEAGI